MSCKKMKLDVRPFQPSWTTDYGFILKNDRAECIFCLETVVNRTSSVKRHYETKHKKSFMCKADNNEVVENVTQPEKQMPVSKTIAGKTKTTECSYKIAQCIANFGKRFTDGDYIKETFLMCSEVLFDDLSNKDIIISRIKEIPTSARTAARRITEMDQNIKEQHTDALKNANVFSVALDESVDINGIPRLLIVTRHCVTEVREELCSLESIQGTSTGIDILKSFIDHFNERGIDIRKIFAVMTDGTPVMIERISGFVNLLEVETNIGHPILKFPCIINQESICAKISNTDLNNLMSTVSKIVNFIVACPSVTKKRFGSLFVEIESAYQHIPLPSNIRWLSCGKVLEKFVECLDLIKVFLKEKSESYPELENTKWLTKLMFLTDLTAHFNELNLSLQRGGQTVMELYETWKAFVTKIDIYIEDIKTWHLHYFKHLRKFIENCDDSSVSLDETEVYMHEIKSEFSNRFEDFKYFGPMFSFLIMPDSIEKFDLQVFEWMDIEEFEMQLVEFKISSLWINKFADLRKTLENLESKPNCAASNSILTCWASLPEKFDSLKKVAFALLSCFGSTYICEQISSHMKHIINPHRSRLTVDHSEACVHLKVSKYSPNIPKLSNAKQDQGSH